MLKRRAGSPEESDCVPSSSRTVGSESPKKRTRHDSASSLPQPQTPIKRRWMSSPGKPPRTPYTPYPLRAMDSPSNPFGRKRKERLVHTLPPVTSFSKHICLRFQFIRADISPRLGGVYRIARVPLSYTFAHLRSLINWLFETPALLSNGKKEVEEYLFEVMNKADTYSMMYKPGQLKTGATTVKLSNVQDPGGWPADHVFPGDDDDNEDATPEDEVEQDWEWMDEEEYTLSHVWQNGLDPAIAIVYHHSSDTQVHITINTMKLPVKRGISNTPEVFLARGRAHLKPWPVAARPSPKPRRTRKQRPAEEQLTDTDAEGDTDEEQQAFSESHPYFQASSSSPAKVLVEDTDCEDSDGDDGNENDNDREAQPEDFVFTREPSRWNKPAHAFPLYLLKFMDPLGISFDDIDASFFEEDTPYDPFDKDDDEGDEEDVVEAYTRRPRAASRASTTVYSDVEDEEDDDDERATRTTLGSTPGLSYGFSSSSSLPPSSSPGRASSPSLFHWGNSSSLSLPDLGSEIVLEEHYPNKKYSATPAPPKSGAHRLRLKRIEKRLERIKKAEFLCVHDEKPVTQEKLAKSAKPVKEDTSFTSAKEGAKKGRGRGHVVSNAKPKPKVKKALVEQDL
ncbi:hypothetical protein D9619_010717 [Psilocybe cf. subviscida]|uniref:Uncharacterized protein n=1 Tax=Psilocybe cf. subviscida TaxID=2480587 RepID=A0A8H5EZZ6_9AGAR|nr:hypothetical protein D9619_010717 [Psilocybe cf. subviscida]